MRHVCRAYPSAPICLVLRLPAAAADDSIRRTPIEGCPVPDDLRLESLLDHYQDRLEHGRVPNLDDLCQDCPELRPEFEKRVARLRKVGRLLGDPQLPATRVEPEPELSLSDDKTWVSQGTGYAPPVEIPAPPGYQVLAPLGEGGMGVVYKAKQIGLERLVALKMILAGSRTRAVDLARFRNEAQAIAALRHPNIVQVFEIGEFRDQPFFSLEFCAGGTLGKAVNGEPQSPAAAAGMTEVLARAVHYAHSRGIVHRDLKPGNVLLSAEPAAPSHAPSTIQADPASRAVAQAALRPPYSSLKITDFGLAKRVDDDSGRTQDGSVMGTPAYMAPEQAFGADQRRRSGHGHPRPRRHPVRTSHRPAAVQGKHGSRHARARPAPRSGRACARCSRRCPRTSRRSV